MYHFHNFGQSLNLGEGPTVGSRVERGAQIGGRGLIAFRGRVRTNTTEVSTGCARLIVGETALPIFLIFTRCRRRLAKDDS